MHGEKHEFWWWHLGTYIQYQLRASWSRNAKNLHVSSNNANLDCRYDSLYLCVCFFLMDAFPFFLVKSSKSHATHLFLTKRFHNFWWLSCSCILHSQFAAEIQMAQYSLRKFASSIFVCWHIISPPVQYKPFPTFWMCILLGTWVATLKDS